MMNFIEIQSVVDSISYKPGWRIQFAVEETAEAALCPFTGTRSAWKGGKRYLSPHMCRQEIVGACIKDAEMHEIHEWFRYKGRAIYNPHLDPDVLASIAVRENLNLRENAMSMTESE